MAGLLLIINKMTYWKTNDVWLVRRKKKKGRATAQGHSYGQNQAIVAKQQLPMHTQGKIYQNHSRKNHSRITTMTSIKLIQGRCHHQDYKLFSPLVCSNFHNWNYCSSMIATFTTAQDLSCSLGERSWKLLCTLGKGLTQRWYLAC